MMHNDNPIKKIHIPSKVCFCNRCLTYILEKYHAPYFLTTTYMWYKSEETHHFIDL